MNIAFAVTAMAALIATQSTMTRNELISLLTNHTWYQEQIQQRGRDIIDNLAHQMTQTINNLRQGQFIDINKIKPENQELFYLIAASHCHYTFFYFSDDYTQFIANYN